MSKLHFCVTKRIGKRSVYCTRPVMFKLPVSLACKEGKTGGREKCCQDLKKHSRNLPRILKVKIRYDEYRAQVRRSICRRRRSAASICVMLLLERAFSVIIAEKTWVFCLKKTWDKASLKIQEKR